MAAVDEAVKKLPPEESLSLHFMSEGGGGMRAPDEPPNWGQKARGLVGGRMRVGAMIRRLMSLWHGC